MRKLLEKLQPETWFWVSPRHANPIENQFQVQLLIHSAGQGVPTLLLGCKTCWEQLVGAPLLCLQCPSLVSGHHGPSHLWIGLRYQQGRSTEEVEKYHCDTCLKGKLAYPLHHE
jgi:hypothetical protein